MKRNTKSLTFFDLLLVLLTVLILSVAGYTYLSGESAAEKEMTVRVFVQYDPLAVDEALPAAGEALMDGQGRAVGEVITASVEQNGSVYLQGRIRASRLPERGESFLVETRTVIREARIVEAYVEENKA